MLIFFKISTYTAIITLFLLSLITLSDIFIHSNQTRFYVMTVIVALFFFLKSMLGIVIYKNFRKIYDHIMAEKQIGSAQISLRKLILFFSFVAIMISLISGSLSFALIQRMWDGMPLFG